MSTRAIIGSENADGTITGGWQWNDGKGLLPLLRKQFNTIEKVQELIRNGVWNNIVPPDDQDTLKHFTDWTKRDNSDYYLIPVEKCHILKERPCDNAEYCFSDCEGITVNEDGTMAYADFWTAQEQDINYLYLFDPESQIWNVYL